VEKIRKMKVVEAKENGYVICPFCSDLSELDKKEIEQIEKDLTIEFECANCCEEFYVKGKENG
jgi:predicted GNAT family acetyltransferase